jgi:dephospho-CoA kinase
VTVFVGLTGGIASGKSTVATLLAARGAIVVDADQVGHELLEVGTPVHDAVVERFGPGIVSSDPAVPPGTIDRRALATVVFSSTEARRDLEGIVHPGVWYEVAERVDAAREAEDADGVLRVVVFDAPLIVETLPDRGRALGLQALIVVSATVEDQVARSLGLGRTDEDVRARIAAQAPPEQKLAAADYVIDNRGTLEDLERSVDALWTDLVERLGARR